VYTSTMAKKYKIAVIGCGSAGAAAAIYLKRAGHDLRIFEKIADPKPVGAGILMQPSGLEVLYELGLLEDVLRLGTRVDRLFGETKKGRPILDIGYQDIDQNAYGLGIHRGALFMALFNAVQKENISVECGVDIQSLEERRDSVVLKDSEGKLCGMFDFVIIADGARSTLRSQIKIDSQIDAYPWGAIWHIADEPTSGPLADGRVLAQVYENTQQMIGFLPTGVSHPGSQRKLTSMFWSIEMATIDTWKKGGLNAWRDQALALSPNAEPLLVGLNSLDELQVAGYHDVRMQTWNTARTAILGDAAHAMSPQLGQGANLALFDAKELDWAMQQDGDLHQCLNAYSRRRKQHLAYYQLASRWLTPIFQSRWPVLSWPRDTLFEPISRIPFVRRQMVESLLGIKTGLFSRMQYRALPPLLPPAKTT